MIQVDMDGVIADLKTAYIKKFGEEYWKDRKLQEEAILQLKNTDFFNTLKPFNTSFKLIEFVKKISNGNWGINSSPLRGDKYNCSYWKRVWLQRYGFMPEIKNLIFTSQKNKYAISNNKPNILIDDMSSNIKMWEEKGGIGIHYRAEKHDLENYLFAEIEKYYENI